MPVHLSPEIVSRRTHNQKWFDHLDGRVTQHAHVGHVHYFNKLGVGDGQVRFREIDWKLAWDEVKRGWSFQYHSFQPFLPEYADEWVEFRDLYEGKDQTISYKAQCGHVKGVYFDQLDGVTENNGVIYPDAFGEGKDYILYFTRSTLKKVVRIREAYKTSTDQTFDFEIKVGNLPVFRGKDKDNIQYEVDTKKPKAFDTDKHTLIGTDKKDGKEWFTYLKTYLVWDSKGKQQVTPAEFYQQGNKLFLRKTVTGAFQNGAVGEVFTDTTTSYYAGSGDGQISDANATFATVRDATSANASNGGSTNIACACDLSGGSYYIYRLFLPADSSGWTDTDTITSAQYVIHTAKSSSNDSDSSQMIIVPTSQASTSTLVGDDFNNLTFTSNGSIYTDSIAYTNPTAGYVAIDLNREGINNINKTGYSMFGLINSRDCFNQAPSGGNGCWPTSLSEYTGTDHDPYLSVTGLSGYAAAGIAFDAATNGNDTTGTSLTFAHTCSGSNRILFVGIVGNTASNLISGVTYNGVAMTQIASSPVQVPSDRYINLYYLVAPATGSNNVVVSASSSTYMAAAAVSYTGAAQTSPIDVDGTTTTASANTLSKALTTTVDNDWTVMICQAGGGINTSGASTDFRTQGGSGTSWAMYDSGINIQTAGSTSLTANWSGTAIGAAIIMAAFKPVSPDTTTDQTITGKARVALVTSQTITGKARATATTSRTITGKGDILSTTSRTIAGLARVTQVVSRTITGLARVALVTSRTVAGLARITATTLQTIAGKADILSTTTRTISGVSRVTQTVLQTITGKARIALVTSRTITGLSRIALITSRTITGLARVTVSTTQTITGKARVTQTVSQTITGLARIALITSKTITGLSRITVTVLQTITGKSRIQLITSKIITGLARITSVVSQTISGVSRIALITSQVITGKARIALVTSQTITGLSRITQTVTQIISGVSRITVVTSQTITGLARVTATTLQTIPGVSRITQVVSRTISGLARVTQTVTQTITGKSRIELITSQIISGLSRVTQVVSATISGLARVSQTVLQTVSGKSRITVSVSQTIVGKAVVSTMVSQTISGTAKIKMAVWYTSANTAWQSKLDSLWYSAAPVTWKENA